MPRSVSPRPPIHICRDASHGALIDHCHLRHLWGPVPGARRRDYDALDGLFQRGVDFVDPSGLARCLGGVRVASGLRLLLARWEVFEPPTF